MTDPSGDSDSPVLVFIRKLYRDEPWVRMGRAICVSFEGDGWLANGWTLSKQIFEMTAFRLAFNQSPPPAIVVNNDCDVIGIVERDCGAIKCRIMETPLWRSELPDEPREVAPAFFVAGPTVFRSEVVLLRPSELGPRR